MTVFEREENAYTLGVQAGLWGYPLAHRVEAFPAALEAKGIGHNSFRKFDRLKTSDDRFVVTPNNLTIDAYAIIDVADGPVVLHVPTLATQRWFIVQIADAFDDVILNVGGSRPAVPGTYVITGPDFSGRVPGDMVQVRFRTTIGFAAVRASKSSAGCMDHSSDSSTRRGSYRTFTTPPGKWMQNVSFLEKRDAPRGATPPPCNPRSRCLISCLTPRVSDPRCRRA